MRVDLDYEVRVYIELADHVSSYPHVTVIVHWKKKTIPFWLSQFQIASGGITFSCDSLSSYVFFG